jgi:hypothetical protein
MASFVLVLAPHTFYHFRWSPGYIRASVWLRFGCGAVFLSLFPESCGGSGYCSWACLAATYMSYIWLHSFIK